MASNEIDPNDHPVRANRGIVIVVVTLGVLIVLGLGGLVYGIALKAGKLGDDTAIDRSVTTIADPAPIPAAGRTIRSMTADGGFLYILVTLPDGRDVVRAYDKTGSLVFEVDPASK